ncbi:GAF domain-containing protein [Streptomyces sp. DSM 44915]|uniref:GAF domain-containing protein n=1 Tax=Streptomyces chisholmiae TaxID=3075540 RepID=A0ABU2JSR3_9ACTN|nr:GAF domain-containing protein [Streptomyces sp. DSM 44915]MDT0268030.1 GAF domain-containing protein [Streptomyces sp. DSM 44915]
MKPLTPDQAPNEGEQRRRRLQLLGLNDTEPEAKFDRIARLAGSLAQAPLAMVNFISDERQMFRGMYTPPTAEENGGGGDSDGRGIAFDLNNIPEIAREAPIDYGFCPHVVAQGSQLALDDVFDYPRFKGNPLVNEMGVRAYLGTPLLDHTGQILGTVCVADMRPRQWDAHHMEGMRNLADTLLSEFQLRDSLLAQQQEMFAVFDGAPFPIMLTQGPNHLLRYANAKQGASFGRVQQLSVGRESLPGLDAVGVFATMDRAYHTGQTASLGEARIASYDATTPQNFSFTCTPVRLSPKAPVSGVLTVAVNITNQSPARNEAQQMAADFTSQVERLGHGGVPGWTQPRPAI